MAKRLNLAIAYFHHCILGYFGENRRDFVILLDTANGFRIMTVLEMTFNQTYMLKKGFAIYTQHFATKPAR